MKGILLSIIAGVLATSSPAQIKPLATCVKGQPAAAPVGTTGYSTYNYMITNVPQEEGKPLMGFTRCQISVKYPPSGVPRKDNVVFTTGHDGSAWQTKAGDNGKVQQQLGKGVTQEQMIA